MPTQQASSIHNAGKILDLTISQAREAERDDLIRRLTDARRLLVDSPITGPEQTGLQAVANHTLFALDQLTDMLQFRRSRLVLPDRAANARNTAAQAERRAAVLSERAAQWQRQLYDSFATIHSDVDFDLQQRVQAVLAEAEHAIAQGDPAKDWDALADRLRARLAEEARVNHDLAVTSCRMVSQRAAQHFKTTDMHIVDPPLVRIPTDLPTQLVASQAPGGKRGTLSSAVNIMLRAYLGFLMFFLLTTVIGLKVPLLIGLVPAAFLSGLAFIEDRKSRLDKRRAEAFSMVRNYVTDFSMRVTKGSRDLLRRLERELGEAYTARVEREQQELSDARTLAEQMLADQEQAASLLPQIDADLALLADLRARATAIIPAQIIPAQIISTQIIPAQIAPVQFRVSDNARN